MTEDARETTPLLGSEILDKVEVYPIIHMIRADIKLTAPDLTYTLIRPLQEKYSAIQRAGNKSVVFCFLINHVHFVRDQGISTRPLSQCRAEVCELIATRILREYGNNTLDMALAITTSWPVYSGADPTLMRVARQERDDLEERVGNAIEMAIIGKARRFIKSSPCQKVIDSIWTYVTYGGNVLNLTSNWSAAANVSIKLKAVIPFFLTQTYKRTPIHFYDPHKAPLLDHYRLKVPAVRSVLEYTKGHSFIILFILFVFTLETNDLDRINPAEVIFMVYVTRLRSVPYVYALDLGTISWWMLDLWFGLDASGFENASQFHSIFGPVLMVTYTCLSNTLLLTVMVSILSHTFSTINEDAAAEVNVFMISFPILLSIAWYERQAKQTGSSGFYNTISATAEKLYDTLPRGMKRLSTDAEIDAVFDIEDEMDTALDTHEYDQIPGGDGLHRRYSQKSQQNRPASRRPSSNAPERFVRRDPSPQPPAAVASPRLRLGSMLNRGAEMAQNLASPLAQIFQPLVVDEDMPEENGSSSLLNVPTGISYGPAHRRKSLMHRTPAVDAAVSRTAFRFPSMGSHDSRDAHQVSSSPDPVSEVYGMQTAEEAEEDEEESGGMIRWMERLDKLEQGQKRIEDLLLRISQNQGTN
ncbi:hypothetical protein HWV62_7698 [Athelia sp. TMB]|nr:hypothetical protein HWV62_7698 [Athelia sp. TMB]